MSSSVYHSAWCLSVEALHPAKVVGLASAEVSGIWGLKAAGFKVDWT